MDSESADPIVSEIRKEREQHAARFGFDLGEIFQDLQEQQQASGRKFVRYPARPAEPASVSSPGDADQNS